MASITALNAGSNLAIGRTQANLLDTSNKLSTGKRINTAADDPSGYAIATGLAVQAASTDAATQNVQNAFNASQVAAGALQQVSGILSQLNTLAIQGSNDFLSSTDRAALQTQANQLVAQANTIAQSVNFNGQPLLNGSVAGPQAGTPAAATVTNNDALVQGTGGVVAQVTAANANFQNPNGAAQGFGGNATTNATIQIQIVNNNGQAQAVATVYNNGTGQTATSAPVSAGGTISGFENLNIKVGNITTADVGQTATIQVSQATPPNTQNSALTVQSGSGEGATTNVAIPGVSSSQLQISNINLSSSLSSTNAQGQIANAIQTLGTSQANLGAQQVALQNQVNNNDIYANNLTASQSSIQDLNYGQATTAQTLNQLQSQINVALTAHNNVLAGAVLGLFR
ncbi:MAG TPA: flagellin [Candidatus Baltobacteraceae bacterium]|nr:flagellin [Candidatus Baltobacteraceae bacterium]